MVIGTLVIGAVGFAVAFQAPPPPSANAGSQNLAEKTWDAVDVLNKMFYPDESYGNSTLSKVVADAAADDPDPLVNSLSRFMPTGSAFQVYLNNGYDRFPLYTNKTPEGQTVAVSYPFEPNWRYHYGATDLRVYKNDSDTAMGTTLIPIFNSNHVQDEGDYLRAEVEGHLNTIPGQDAEFGGGDYSYIENAYSTLVQGDDTVDYPSASIRMQCERTNGTAQPCYAVDLTGSATEGYDPMDETTEAGDELEHAKDGTTVTWHRLDFEVHNRGPGAVTENTTLTIDFPVGLQVKENVSAVHGRLDDITYEGTYPEVQTVTAEVSASEIPAGESAELEVWVRVDDSRYAFKQIDARLEGGAVSSSQLLALVDDKPGDTYSGGDTRRVLVSSPKPAGAVSGDQLPTGRWGVVMTVPSTRQEVTNLTLDLTQGEGHFDDVRYPHDWQPEWPNEAVGGGDDLALLAFSSDNDNPPSENSTLTVDSTTIEWSTDESNGHVYPAYTFVEMQFIVTTDGELTEASPEFPFARPTAEFHDFFPRGQSTQVDPGIWWSEYPPQTGDSTPAAHDDLPGYAGGADSPNSRHAVVPRTFDQEINHRNSKIAGSTTYHEADLRSAQGALKDAIQASQLSVTPQRVVLGETAEMTLETFDLGSYLSSTVGLQYMNLTTEVYAPWGIPELKPVKTYHHEISGGPIKASNVLKPAYLNADDAQDVIVASADGNIYGVNGNNGDAIAGRSFPIPQSGTGDETAEPILLSRAFQPGVGQVYAVGTDGSTDTWHLLGPTLEERWKASKLGGDVKTLGVNTSIDLDGDNVPDVVASHATADAQDTASLITVRSGVDADGDGEGDILPGWDASLGQVDEKTVPGSATELGMGNLGAEAGPGVYANTGLQVSGETEYSVNTDNPNTESDGLEDNVNLSVATSVSKTGLVGFYADARRAWNFSGGQFLDVTTTDELSTGRWSGLLATDRRGWMYGFNGSQPIPPVEGQDFTAYDRFTDVAMANALEGYVASPDGGLMLATDDGWGSYLGSPQVVTDPDEPPVHAVDTPDGPYLEGYGNVSWWAGDAGTLLRSTDRLDTINGLTTTGQLVATLQIDSASADVTDSILGLSTDTIDLTNVNFRDVLAESRDEAWFVGKGVSGTTLDGEGYLVHTEDGGETMDVYEVECVEDGVTLDRCGVNAISRSGNQLWIAGENGLVLLHEDSGDATHVTLTESPGFVDYNGYGNLVLNLSASPATSIANVTVDWSPLTDLDWMRGVRLHEGRPDLWNVSDGECCYDGDLSTGDGVGPDTTVFVDDYVDQGDVSETDATREIDGNVQLLLGPFKQTLLPTSGYFSASHYDSLVTNFTVDVTFDDNSTDRYLVEMSTNGWYNVTELDDAGWKKPSQAGYDGPSACFGQPKGDCGPYHGINFTQTAQGVTGAVVGKPQANTSTTDRQASIVRLGPGSTTFEPLWNASVNQTFRDVAISPSNSSRWVLAGDGGRVVASWDQGETWTDLQSPWDVDDDALAVDYTHPDVAEIVGENLGDGDAFKWTLGGYREHGRATTVELSPEDSSTGGKLEKVSINTSDLEISDVTYPLSYVLIEIWDGGYEGWSTVHVPSGENVGWKNHSSSTNLANYTYSAPTDDVKLRFTLYTSKALSRWSSQVRGNATILGFTDASASSDVTVKFDIGDASNFQSLGELDHSTEHAYLRLPSVNIPWVQKLGNREAGPWNETKSKTSAPRINDVSVAPDGQTAYVGTAGIYDYETSQYETSTQATHGLSLAYDNSLYRVNVSNGSIDWSWGPVRFEDSIQKVRAGDEAVYVFVKNETDDLGGGEVKRIKFSNASAIESDSILNTRVLETFAVFDGFPDNNNVGDDVVLSMLDTETNDALLQARTAPDILDIGWVARPSMKANFAFAYDVPRSAMFGTNVIATQITWNVTDERGENILQTAKIHNSFAVTPPNRRIPLSPSYNLEVIAWMEDWG